MSEEGITRRRGVLATCAHACLTHRHLPFGLASLAVALAIPSLWAGWALDDHHHRFRLTTTSELATIAGSRTDLFTFADGNTEHTHRLMDIGFWPWWTLPEIKASFFRPLTVATHWLDYRFWPNNAAVMHVQSLAWFAALIAAVTVLYRRLDGPCWVAGLAALLYAIDDAHATPAGWLANRNGLLTALFGVLAILAHDRWRRDRWIAGSLVGPACLLLSLLAKEAGIATCAYLFAYAVFVDHGSLRRRLGTLLPYALLVVAWRIAWTELGYGVWGIGIYVDPLTQPLRYLGALAERTPLMLLAQWLGPPADIYLLLLGFGITGLCAVTAAVILCAVGIVVLPRLHWNAMTWFWAVGMMLSVMPVCAGFPGDRLLLFVGLGAFALLARFFSAIGMAGTDESDAGNQPPRRVTAKAMGILFVIVHIVVAPIALVVRASMPMGPPSLAEKLMVQLPEDTDIEGRTVVVVTAPIPILVGQLIELRAIEGLPLPAHARALAPHRTSSVVVTRPDRRTLVIRPAGGFLKLPSTLLGRTKRNPFSLGERVELTGMTVEIRELTKDRRPAEVSFTFAVPLEDQSLYWLYWEEDPSVRWLLWNDGRFVPFTPPQVGETVDLASFTRSAAPQ